MMLASTPTRIASPATGGCFSSALKYQQLELIYVEGG